MSRAACMDTGEDAGTSEPPAGAATPSPLPLAQRCATDALACVFSFLSLGELLACVRSCRDWHDAASHIEPHALSSPSSPSSFHVSLDFSRMAALCSGRSPLRRLVSSVSVLPRGGLMLLDALRLLRTLPTLTALESALYADELHWLLLEQGAAQALADLRAWFPPSLRFLRLALSSGPGAPVERQMLLDALPAMPDLERLELRHSTDDRDRSPPSAEALASASISFDPLMRLSRLAHLRLAMASLTPVQLASLKQMCSLRTLQSDDIPWNNEQLAALSRPPHGLQRLEEILPPDASRAWSAVIGADTMALLLHLPGLTSLRPHRLLVSAYALLPRLACLRSLRIRVVHAGRAQRLEEDRAAAEALHRCTALIELTVEYSRASEGAWARLLQSVPRLRSLRLESCLLPSLRFLRHAPTLTALDLVCCTEVRPGHVVGMLGRAMPLLASLSLVRCESLRLDDWEVEGLTPPTHALPNLRRFVYEPHHADAADSDDDTEDEEEENE